MAYCPGCGAVNEGLATDCAACGRVLAVICPKCQTHNLARNSYCSKCGRILGETVKDKSKSDGEPIAAMVAPKISEPVHWPYQKSVLKIAIGGFIFLLIFLSKGLTGYPVLSILLSLASGATVLWGVVEILQPYIEKSFKSEIKEELETELESLSPIPISELQPTDGSFQEIEKEIVKPPPISQELFSSMVATSVPDSNKTTPDSEERLQTEDKDVGEFDAEINRLTSKKRDTTSLVKFLEEGIQEEIEFLEKRIQKSPQNFSLKMKLAQLYDERGDLSKALELMNRCVLLKPENPDVYLYHGILLKRSGDIEGSRQAFKKALSINQFLSKAYYQIGVIERSQKNLQAAKEAFQKCIQLSPDDAYAHYQLGMVYRELGNLSLAQMELKRAVILNPNDSYGHSQLGQIFQQAKQWDQAIHEYSQALAIKPNDSYVLEKLGETLLEKGELEKACSIFQEALANQFHPELHTMEKLARTLLKLGKMKDLQPIVEEILRLVPTHEDALYFQALCQISNKDQEGALLTLEKLTKIYPEKWEAWIEMGKLLQELDRQDEALTAFMKAAPSAVDQAGIWNTIGIMLSNKKDFAGALNAFRKAISYDYSDQQIQTNFKMIQKKIEANCKKTIEKAEEKLKKDPSNIESYLELGRAYEALGKPEEALMAYQRLLAIKPDDIQGLMAYGLLLRTRGKLKMAIRCFKEILKLKPDYLDAGINLVTANLNLGFLNEALRQCSIIQKLAPEDPRIHFLLGKIYFAKGLAPRALKEFSFVSERSSDPDMVSWAELMRRRLARSL